MSVEAGRSATADEANQAAWSWRRPEVRAVAYQSLLVGMLAFGAWYFISTAAENLQTRRIASGFGFLTREAGFEIGETTIISYSAADTYLKALAAGLLNTLWVATLAILFSTLFGVALGFARISPNWLLAKIAAAYVEVFRNAPLVVQLFFWYAIITDALPAPAEALNLLPGLFFSNRGVAFPTFSPTSLAWDLPVLEGFNFSGGASLSPEFAALLIGLSLYTASFIAEIVRAGILSVDAGQYEAAHSLGHNRRQAMRFIILPQALRLIVPPLASQYLNCTKNSSLAVAIGYPDLVSIVNTTINQTGQAIEGIAVIMAVYLTISLATSALMNWYNRRIGLRGFNP
jgi:general L-amino acid transport system permease protein